VREDAIVGGALGLAVEVEERTMDRWALFGDAGDRGPGEWDE
jgi:hypothetical protein